MFLLMCGSSCPLYDDNTWGPTPLTMVDIKKTAIGVLIWGGGGFEGGFEATRKSQ